jgi:hypothetical protein
MWGPMCLCGAKIALKYTLILILLNPGSHVLCENSVKASRKKLKGIVQIQRCQFCSWAVPRNNEIRLGTHRFQHAGLLSKTCWR